MKRVALQQTLHYLLFEARKHLQCQKSDEDPPFEACKNLPVTRVAEYRVINIQGVSKAKATFWHATFKRPRIDRPSRQLTYAIRMHY